MNIEERGDWVQTEYEGIYINIVGQVMNWKTGKILTPYLDERGCYRVIFMCNGVHKNPQVHQMLAKAYLPRCDKATGVIFIDGDKSNYSLENLDWRIPREKPKKGEEHPLITNKMASVNKTRKDASGIYLYRGQKEMYFESVRKAASYLECTPSSIYAVLNGNNWTVCGWKVRWEYEPRPIYIKNR